MNTIFPNSCQDADWRIVLCLEDNKDGEGLQALSVVNRRAYELLPNAPYFAELFKRWHPQLNGCGLNFQVLTRHHSSNGWKVACCSFSRGVFKVNKPFLEMAIPLLCESLKGKKSGVQAQLKDICGDYYKDPKSPIHIAWNFWETCKQKRNEIKLEKAELIQALGPFYSEDDLEIICWLCRHRGADFLLSEKGKLVGDFSVEQLEVINPDHIPQYQRIVKSIRAFESVDREIIKLLGEYDALEKKRIACEKELAAVVEELNSLVPGEALGLGLQKHAYRLENEFAMLLRAEEALLNSTLLQQCLELCLEVQNGQSLSEDQKNQICGLINSCSNGVKKAIWSPLYFHFADGSQQEQWSEKHFHEYLSIFISTVTGRLNCESQSILNAKQAQLKALQL